MNVHDLVPTLLPINEYIYDDHGKFERTSKIIFQQYNNSYHHSFSMIYLIVSHNIISI